MWRLPLDKFKLGTPFGVTDDAHPNGHRGDDYNGVREGTRVKAVNDGTVVFSGFSSVLGNVVVVRVKLWFFGYCHLKTATVAVGAKVASGDTIGLLGNTGSASSGPHLHFTLSLTKQGVFSGKVFSAHKFLTKVIATQEARK